MVQISTNQTNTTEISDEAALRAAATNGGSVKLTDNITLATYSVVVQKGKELTIDLNGHTITAANNERAFQISNGGKLTICDSVGTGVIQGNGTVSYNDGGGAIRMQDAESKLVISGGTIQGFTASTHGGGVYMNGGTFEMTGGRIDNCSAGTSGGGVYMTAGTFNMEGGSIEDCKANEGAGVKVYPGSGETCTFTMSGTAAIKNCSTDGVSIASSGTSKFNMNGGTIDNNKGYGLWTSSGSNTEITLSGGTITNNEKYDMVVHTGVKLTANDTPVSGKIQNRGTITGTGSTVFTGTVVNESVGKIQSGKFERIEDISSTGVDNAVDYKEYVKLIAHRWADENALKELQNKTNGNVQLKFSSQVTPNDMENTLTIPEGVTVNFDLTGKQIAAQEAEYKIINNGTLTLVDSGAGTLSIPIENNGTINANGGTVTSEVTNKGEIKTTGATATQFAGTVTNGSDGKIESGVFTGTVTNNGKIVDGKYAGEVTNNGTIDNGKFTGTVTNEETGTIASGDFTEGKLINNGGTVSSDVVKPEEPEKPNPEPDGPSKDNEQEKPNPDDTKKDDDAKDDDKPGTEEPEKPVTKLYALTIKNAEVTAKTADGKTVEVAKAEDGTLTAKVPEGAKVTVKYTAPTDAIVFDLWSITSDAKLDVNVKENPLTFTMPDKAVTVEAMTRDATIESEGPGVLGTAAMIGVGVAGTAVLGYQGYMIGTELYLDYVLPAGAAIPQNYSELAKLVWDNAGSPEPVALLAADATDEQKALTWAVENQLISADKAADASVTRWEVIQAWNQAQERKQA